MRRISAVLAVVAFAAVLQGCASSSEQRTSIGGQPIPQADMDMLAKQQFVQADGEAARSEALYQSLLRKLPNDSDTWFRLGNLYASNNRPEPAAAAYSRALVADNGHARAWHNLAVIRLRQAYAALAQAQMTVDPSADEALSKRIDGLIEELSRVSALADERKPATPERKTP